MTASAIPIHAQRVSDGRRVMTNLIVPAFPCCVTAVRHTFSPMAPTHSPLSRREFTQLLGAAVLGPMLPDASLPISETMTAPASPSNATAAADHITTVSRVDAAGRR